MRAPDPRWSSTPFLQAAYPVQYYIHISLVVQDENGGRPWLHQPLHLRDEVAVDSNRGRDRSSTSASHHGADGRADKWTAEHQAREEAHHAAAQDVGRGRERLSVERERSVGMPHDHCNIVEYKVMLVPPQADDFSRT